VEGADERTVFSWHYMRHSLLTISFRFKVTLTLIVDYADGYPDVLPELSLELARGEVSNAEIASLVSDLRAVVGAFLVFLTAQLPMMIGWSHAGGGKSRDGHDVHIGVSTARAALGTR
jgi:hypothetical protein